MSATLINSGPQPLRINCHDPRSHQNFLQFSNDMHRWQTHASDSSWWLEREKQCLALFDRYGYDLQTGLWYCLIACHRNGWKGIASATQLLANGFARQQMPCWPPLAAVELRRQLLDGYCRQLLPLIYVLPMAAVSASALELLQSAAGLLEKQAIPLQSPQHTAFRQLSAWLEAHINTLEQQAVASAVSPAAVTRPVACDPPVPILEQETPARWPGRLIWCVLGAAMALSVTTLIQKADDPDVLRFSNQIWPDNPLVEHRRIALEKMSAALPVNKSVEQLSQQLDTLEQRLLDAEQKRKPYMTISELKTSVYQMRDTLHQQATMVEQQLNQLQQQQLKGQPVSDAALYTLSLQLEALKSRLLLLSEINANRNMQSLNKG
ncbi:VasL domain-containing protein [Enterobacter sp. P82]|uniref:VasL domain-containing protein n=1 Tax=Enterobacter sp. P82 TaxID=3123033 RepID=UPI00300DB729